MPDPIKSLIDDGLAEECLFNTLNKDPCLEIIVGLEPDYELLARLVAESFKKDLERNNADYNEVLDALRKSIPDIYDRLIQRYRAVDESDYVEKIDWKRVEELLPNSFEEPFSIDSLIDSGTKKGLADAMWIAEIYLQSGMTALSIISKTHAGEKIRSVDRELFRKAVVAKLTLDMPGRLKGNSPRFIDTEDLADRCLAVLENRYCRV